MFTRLRVLSPAVAFALCAFGVCAFALSATTLAIADEPLTGRDLPESIAYVTSVEGIHEYRLDNGVRVLLFPDPSKQTATVNITYLVGSLHENYGETGMAHLLEHLLFKGTPDHPSIPDELTSHGARPNGTTWFDRTNYFETFSATEENLEWALDMEADRMVNSFVSREDLDSEMTVVRNEFEIGENNPRAVLEERVYSTAFLWHNYGNTTIGSRSDIENVPIDRLQGFYRKWYRPDNAVLVVAGQFDPKRTLELIDEKFGPLTAPDTPMQVMYTTEPAQDGERRVTLRRVGDYQVVMAGYHVPSGAHPDYAALAVLANIMGDTPRGRLHKALVETKKATRISGSADRFRDASLFVVSADVAKDGDLNGVHDEVLAVVEGLREDPPSADEVERAKAALLRGWENRLRNSSWAAIRLTEWSAMGDWRLMFIHRDRLKTVTAEDVSRVAMTYLQDTNRTVGLYVPTDEPMRVEVPATPDIETMVAAYVGGEALAQGEEFDPSPSNIESHLVRATLDNGLKIVMLPKKTRGETVNLSLALHFGTEESLSGRRVAGDVAGDMLMRGTTTLTREDISNEIDRLQATFRVNASAVSASASIQVSRENLDDTVRLLADVLRNPAFDDAEFEQLRQQQLVRLEEQKTSPWARVSTRLGRHLDPREANHVSYTPTIDESMADMTSIDLASLKDFHRDYYGASAAEIAVVGDFDATAMESLLGGLFGDWTAKMPYERVAGEYQDRPAIDERIQIPDKESAVMNARLNVKIRDDNEAYPAMSLGSLMMGGGFLNSRLATRIRQDDGLSYGVGSWFWAGPIDEEGGFGGYAMYAPQNDAKLVVAFTEEMEKASADGFTPEEVDEAKSGWLQQRRVSRSNDNELAPKLRQNEYLGRTMDWDAKFESKVAELTPKQIHESWRRFIEIKKISIVRAGDFEKGDEVAAKEVSKEGTSS